MSQQMRRILVAVGLAAALLLVVPAPSRAATFQEPAFAAGLVERLWIWLWGQAQTLPVKDASTPVPLTNGNGNGNGSTSPPSGTTESGSMIDPDGKP